MEMDRVPPCSPYYLQQFDTNSVNQNHTEPKHECDTSKVAKVHVNPNFRNGKSLVIHVNPKMQQKRKIHVNPKMMKDIVPVVETDIKAKTLKNIDKIPCNDRLCPEEKQIKKNIHVNPKMMKKFSSIAPTTSSKSTVDSDKKSLPITYKINRNIVCVNKIPGKTASPRLLAISRRKLVRIGTNTKTTTIIQSPSSLKRLNRKSFSAVQVDTKKSVSPRNAPKFNPIRNKYKPNAYKIDRTVVDPRKRKKNRIPDARIQNVNKGLVAIGGVMYQSSRTQLVRSGTSTSLQKRKSCPSNTTDVTFVMAKNGKKLQRLYPEKGGSSSARYMISRNSFNHRTVVKKVPNSIVQSSNKNVMSYKAKQRSLQILRDKLRKNYIPCLLYRRFGYCAKHAKGTCPKLHDKKQVALCKNFLQGKCLLDACPLSHDIGPEKMPTCKYFLEGCCIRDACPYLHVKVSPNTPVCPQFLRGYCADGNKCKQRHTYICPEYEKSGKCAKGKYCPYPHKLKSSAALATKSSVMKSQRRSTSSKRVSNNVPSNVIKSVEGTRKRYYDNACPSDKQLAQMRESIIKKMKCMKASLGACDLSDKITEECGEKIVVDNVQEPECNYDERPKRTPIGPLPAYIPIN